MALLLSSNFNLIIHHICALFGLCGRILDGYGSSEMLDVVFFGELSNPFYLSRTLFQKFFKPKKYENVSGGIFIVIFTIARYFCNKGVVQHVLNV